MHGFESLEQEHHVFLESLLLHQEQLVRGDLDAARATLVQMRATLDEHAALEEAQLLPLLEERGGWSRIGDPRFYRQEHEKLRAMLADLVAAAEALDASDAGVHRAIALLIGREQSLKTLLEHHHDREENALFPDLERVTTPEERARLFEAGA